MFQPTLAFASRKSSAPSPVKKKTAPVRQSSLRQSVSTDDIRRTDADDDDDATIVTSDDDEKKVVIQSETGSGKIGERKKLDVKSKRWDGVYRDAKKSMGGLAPSEF